MEYSLSVPALQGPSLISSFFCWMKRLLTLPSASDLVPSALLVMLPFPLLLVLASLCCAGAA